MFDNHRNLRVRRLMDRALAMAFYLKEPYLATEGDISVLAKKIGNSLQYRILSSGYDSDWRIANWMK